MLLLRISSGLVTTSVFRHLNRFSLKKSRLQYLEEAGSARARKKYTCSNCDNIGHTIKTCTVECKISGSLTCCAHLVKNNGKYHLKCTLSTDTTPHT